MKILRFDSVGGASGDMLLGALLGLAPEALLPLQAMLDQLLPHHARVHFTPSADAGITGFKAHVELLSDPEAHHDHHHHDQHEGPGTTAHHHSHHHFSEIKTLLEHSTLEAAVKRDAIGVFTLLAHAEAKVHGKSVADVAFHEVGAVDSIVDIVGNCFLYHYLGADAIECSPLPTGYGTVTCQHGVLPVPAPATAEILALGKLAVYAGNESGELLTPTGAAILSYFAPQPPRTLKVLKTANSFGDRHLQNGPNLLRATLAETAADSDREIVWELRSNLDDMTGEQLGALSELLQNAGALDCSYTPLTMKKSRPGVQLCVICRPNQRAELLQIIFKNSSALGVRYFPLERAVLTRETGAVATRFGQVPVKAGYWQNQLCSVKLEYEAGMALAQEVKCSLSELQAEAAVQFRKACEK